MPTYDVNFYDYDPFGNISQTVGGLTTWSGPATADGTATITDTETGIEGLTLDDDDAGGETATATATVGGSTSTGVNVDAEESWTLRDTITGEVFQVVTLQIEGGGASGYYTLSEVPLIVGRQYETLAFSSNPNVNAGDPVFNINDYVSGDGTVTGTAGNDTIDASYTGDPEGDQIDDGNGSGPSGNGNIVYAEGGNDLVESGLGDDLVYGGTGTDSLYGGSGDDTLHGEDGADLIYGDDGDFTAGGGDDSLTGGAGNDSIFGESGDDTISGGADNDSLAGGDGADSISGDDGNDRLLGEDGNDTLSGGDGTDYIRGGTGNDSIDGGSDNDTIEGGADDDTIDGGSGADTITGDAGDDSISGGGGSDTIEGGTGADTIDGDGGDRTEVLDWTEEGGDGTNLSPGFTQNTGEMDVTVTFTDDGNNNPVFEVATDTNYVDGGEEYDANSSLYLFGNGDAATSTSTFDFSAATGAQVEDEVENVSFRINDIDWATGNHQDVITINAFDANGDPVTVTFTPAGNDTVSGNTITAGLTGESAADAAGSVLIEIAGPLSQIEIIYSNALTGTQGVNITDVYFETIPLAADAADSISGGSGDDQIDGGFGDDTISGDSGNDTITGGTGEDVFVLQDGSGADVITDFSLDDSDGDGFFEDQFDVSNLTDADGNPVNAWDVVVSDDGSGNALLTFPNGETVVLIGVTPAQMTGAQNLASAGIPCATEGTLVSTPRGEIPIEKLKVGDTVLTMDNGPQEIKWIGCRHLGRKELEAEPKNLPILIPEGVVGNYAPLLVSPQHGMFLDQNYTGKEVFVRAKHLAEAQGPVRVAKGKKRVTYFHLMFEEHQVIFENGAATESFYPGPQTLKMFPDTVVNELKEIIPGLGKLPVEEAYGPTARPVLKRKEVISSVSLKKSRAVAAQLAKAA